MRDLVQSADTIVALSTPEGPSPRAIVRLSGSQAEAILTRLIRNCGRLPQGTYQACSVSLCLGSIRLPARLYVMRAPRSYTRQDIIEIHTFGAPVLTEELIARLVSLGARPAAPGEFTRRAFLNGRIDLAQAEAVEAIISAQGESEYRAAHAALAGHLSRRVRELRAQLADLAAAVAVALDFSDQDIEIISLADALARLQPIHRQLAELLAARNEGRIRTHAVRVVLFGPPNAGKSSLFNAILERRQAIVSPHPGTTRDTLEAQIRVGSARVALTDTAGLCQPTNSLEAAAVTRSEDTIHGADLRLCVLDAVAAPAHHTGTALQLARGQRTLIILNKSDLGPCRPELEAMLPQDLDRVTLSATTGHAVNAALHWVARQINEGRLNLAPGRITVNARQAHLLRRALSALDRILVAQDCGHTMDLVADDITDALSALSDITGDAVTADVLDRVFADFCIGK